MVLWEYQIYTDALLLAQKPCLKVTDKAKKQKTEERYFFKTMLIYDTPLQYDQVMYRPARQTDLIEKYFRFNNKRLPKSVLSRSEFNYADMGRVKLTKDMSYLSNYFLNKHLKNTDTTWLKDAEFKDGSFLYEEYKERTPIALLKHKYKDLLKNEKFKKSLLRSHSIERVDGKERNEPN